MNDKLYTTQEVAEILRVAENTVRKFIRQQKLGATVVGRNYRVSEDQLQDYYRANTIERKDIGNTKDSDTDKV